MKAILQIARTEILEHRRQPWMIAILALTYVIWLLGFGVPLLGIDGAASDPALQEKLRQALSGVGMAQEKFFETTVSLFCMLLFNELPLFVALMAATSVLHDRESGTMPFLMLAPVTRRQLIAGKLAGAMAIPLVFHVVFVGTGCLLIGRLGSLAPFAHRLGYSPAWWVAFLVGTPAAAVFVGALGTVISALSADTRTSMQFTNFCIGLLSLAFGAALVDAIPRGIGLQLAFAAGCLLAAGLTLGLGARLISRDVAAP